MAESNITAGRAAAAAGGGSEVLNIPGGGPKKTNGRGFRDETAVEHASRFASKEFESLSAAGGGPGTQRYDLHESFAEFGERKNLHLNLDRRTGSVKEELKAYVQGPSLQVHSDDTVLLHISHSNLKHYRNQLRLSLHSTVDSVKEKLSHQCGTTLDSMLVQLYDDNNTKICDLVEVSRPLGFYSPLEGYRLHIVDLDPTSITVGGWLEDTSLVEKYTISEEAYNKRDDTFKKFKEKRLAEVLELNSHKITDNYMEDLAAGIHVSDRCEVNPGSKRGTVMFVGRAETLGPGFWVGVQYDEPVGKHDGIVKGHRYFNCLPAHGSMLRPDKVKVGDFPEVDPFEEELDEI